MFCPKCGAENPEGSRFCGECGCDIQEEQEHQSVPEEKSEKRSSKNEKTVIIGLFVVIIVVAAFFVWQMILGTDIGSGVSSSSKTTTEAETKTTTEATTGTTDTQQKDTTEEKDQDLPSITSQSQIDYDKILDLDDYETFYAGDYSFGFPKELYKDVVKVGDSYEFRSDTYNYLIYRRQKLSSGTTVKKKLKSSYASIRNNLTNRNEILYKEENGVFVIAGQKKDNTNQALYYLVRIENGYIYSMTIGYRYTSDKTQDNKKNYYIDTMYRMCSFGRGTYQPRTYQQFLNDDMGTKK